MKTADSGMRRAPEIAPGPKARFSARRIRSAVRRMAKEISKRYAGHDVLMIGVLKGGTFLLADLAREMSIPVRLDFLRVASYGSGTSPGACAVMTKDIETDVAGKDVVVVEDIVDTGRSIDLLRRHFEGKGARSVAFCALVDKRSRRESDYPLDFSGFKVKDGFLVGYGMDHAEAYRQLPAIYDLPASYVRGDGQAVKPGGFGERR